MPRTSPLTAALARADRGVGSSYEVRVTLPELAAIVRCAAVAQVSVLSDGFGFVQLDKRTVLARLADKIERDVPALEARKGGTVMASVFIAPAYIRRRASRNREAWEVRDSDTPQRYHVSIATIGIWEGESIWLLR
jgi:hypothetical protein